MEVCGNDPASQRMPWTGIPVCRTVVHVTGPDGITAFEKLPGVSWTWTSNGSNMLGSKCPSNVNIDTADAFLLNIAIPNLHPTAKVVAVLPNPPSMQDAIAKDNEQGAAHLRSFRQQGRVINDFGRVLIEYERNGSLWRKLWGQRSTVWKPSSRQCSSRTRDAPAARWGRA
ncbi:MAG: hypothetical protein ABI076_01405 [Acidobacteriaceae bacterium]